VIHGYARESRVGLSAAAPDDARIKALLTSAPEKPFGDGWRREAPGIDRETAARRRPFGYHNAPFRRHHGPPAPNWSYGAFDACERALSPTELASWLRLA
jgi:hypothetical protein